MSRAIMRTIFRKAKTPMRSETAWAGAQPRTEKTPAALSRLVDPQPAQLLLGGYVDEHRF